MGCDFAVIILRTDKDAEQKRVLDSSIHGPDPDPWEAAYRHVALLPQIELVDVDESDVANSIGMELKALLQDFPVLTRGLMGRICAVCSDHGYEQTTKRAREFLRHWVYKDVRVAPEYW
jgi:hypothetical protein